jgi:O-antigen ligase
LLGRRTLVKPYAPGAQRFVVIGFFPNYLTYAHSLIIPLSWAVAGVLGNGGWVMRRSVAAGSAGLLLLALLLSTARGAWMAAGVVIVVACLLSDLRRSLAVGGGAVALAAVLFSISPGLRAEARSIVDHRANAGRLAIYAANVDLVRDHPVFGVGFGNYDRRARPYYDKHPEADRRSHAHNMFLQVAAEAGIVGLLAFCSLFAVVVVRGWRLLSRLGVSQERLRPTVTGAWLAVIGFLVGGLTQDTFADSECAMAMWFAVAVLMTIDRVMATDGVPAANPSR